MIANLTLYPAYEHSGVEWLGSVPQHWDVRRLATSVYGCVNGTWGRDPNGREDLPCIRVADFDRVRLRVGLSKPTFRAIASRERNHRLLKNGDLLIEKSGGGDLQPVGAVMLYDHDTEAVCSNFVARMPVARHCDAGYLTYLHSHLYAIRLNVRSIKQTTGIQNLDSSSYLGETVAFPPLAEQVAIVRYLGHADRRIRRYIRAKERLIELLEEQTQAIIHQAVTGQIDVRTGKPYPAYKDSAVAWLGKVPEHWVVSRFGRLIGLTVGFPFKSEGFTQSAGDIRLLRGVNVAPGELRWDKVVRWPKKDAGKFAEFQMALGDIVLGMDRPIIRGGVRLAMVSQSDVPSLLLQRVARIRPSSVGLIRDFAFVLLSGNSFLDYLAPIFTGISVPHLSPEQIRAFSFALPSVVEQKAIVEYLRTRISDVRSAVNGSLKQIDLVREYRTRLIADVVTGQLDVREAVGSLPEVDALAESLSRNPEALPKELDCALL